MEDFVYSCTQSSMRETDMSWFVSLHIYTYTYEHLTNYRIHKDHADIYMPPGNMRAVRQIHSEKMNRIDSNTHGPFSCVVQKRFHSMSNTQSCMLAMMDELISITFGHFVGDMDHNPEFHFISIVWRTLDTFFLIIIIKQKTKKPSFIQLRK